MAMITLDPSDNANVTLTWDNLGSATVSTVSYSAPAGVTITPGTVTSPNSTFRITGLVHGRTYQVEAQATLSSGEVLNRNVPIRAFNG